MEQFALGLDYGTLSVRALLVNIDTGAEAATAVFEYPHGVMSRALLSGVPLPPGYALAHPADYLQGLRRVIRQVMAQSGLAKEQVVGIGIDATSSSLVPVDEAGTPLCLVPGFEQEPHAYIKLWKHHGQEALELADRLGSLAEARGEPWGSRYGGRFNGESLVPKSLETAAVAPRVYAHSHRLLELGEWLTRVLTGADTKSRSMAACNSLYGEPDGYPSPEFFEAVLPQARGLGEKFASPMVPLGASAGGLTPEMAQELGLCPGTPVSAAMIDCHAAVPGCGAGEDGDLVMVLGTSSCFLLNTSRGEGIPGISSVAYEAHIPGLYGCEAGQSCVGDSFQWFVDSCVPESTREAARQAGQSIYAYLEEQAQVLAPGESGLLALDWWNGVRTPLLDYQLSGVLLGLTIATTPPEMYRALVEAACYGAKQIIDLYQDSGRPVKRLLASGGLAQKNQMMMQILADVCQKEVIISGSNEPCALGSAIMGAHAALGGDFRQRMARMCPPPQTVYRPDPHRGAIYQELYREYRGMFDYFSKENRLVERLHQLRVRQKALAQKPLEEMQQ